MNCETIPQELPFHLRGELDPDVTAFVESHIEACEGCAHEVARFTELFDALGAAKPSQAPQGLRSEVLTRIEGLFLEDRVQRHVSVPPEGMRARVLEGVRSLQAPETSELETRRRSRERLLLKVTTVAALIALLGFGLSLDRLGNLQEKLDAASGEASRSQERTPDGHEMQTIALAGQSDATATLDHYRHDNFRLNLSVVGYDVTPAGFQYAVWLRGESGDVALGGFRLKRADNFTVPFAIAVDPVRYPELVVTLEPLDGDPALTGEVVNSASLVLEQIHHGAYDE